MTVKGSANSVILILFAFSDNLSAEKSKSSADFYIQLIQLLECMDTRSGWKQWILQDPWDPGWFGVRLSLRYMYVMADIGCFCLNLCRLFESAPVLSVESETCLGSSEKEGGLKKGEISKGEKWLSPCMYVLHCWLCYLLMASRHRTWLGYLARFVSSTSSDASATQWLIGVSLIDKIFFATRNISPSQKYSHTKILKLGQRF